MYNEYIYTHAFKDCKSYIDKYIQSKQQMAMDQWHSVIMLVCKYARPKLFGIIQGLELIWLSWFSLIDK